MRAIRQSGSEGGAAGVTTGRPYPYTVHASPTRLAKRRERPRRRPNAASWNRRFHPSEARPVGVGAPGRWDALGWRGRSYPSLRDGEAHRAGVAVALHDETNAQPPRARRRSLARVTRSEAEG